MNLSESEKKRYGRQILLADFGEAGQAKLKGARVLVVGAGGLGCPALMYLAASGVGTLGFVDGDRVEASNLQRQILYRVGDVGRPKVTVAKEVLSALNPEVTLVPHEVFLTPENARELIGAYDLVLDGTDQFSTRYLVNDACVLENKPFVSGSIFRFEAQVAVYNHQGSGTYRCLFPEPPEPESVPNCSEIGVWAVLPGVAGTLMASEAIKVLTGCGQPLTDRLLVMDLWGQVVSILGYQKNDGAKVKALLDDYGAFCQPGVKAMEITLKDLVGQVAKGEAFLLIDVREPGEDESLPLAPALAKQWGGTIPQPLEIRKLPMSQLAQWKDRLEKNKNLVVSCQKGGRSLKVTRELRASGFDKVRSLSGGQSEVATSKIFGV